jgi:hypothetical protein
MRRLLIGSVVALGVFAAVMAVDNKYCERRAWYKLTSG